MVARGDNLDLDALPTSCRSTLIYFFFMDIHFRYRCQVDAWDHHDLILHPTHPTFFLFQRATFGSLCPDMYKCCRMNVCTLNTGFCPCTFKCCRVNVSMCVRWIFSFCRYICKCCCVDMCTLNTGFWPYIYKCWCVDICTLNFTSFYKCCQGIMWWLNTGFCRYLQWKCWKQKDSWFSLTIMQIEHVLMRE